MSSNKSDPAGQFAQGTMAYRRVDGVEIAPNWMTLVTGMLENAIDVDDAGRKQSGSAWTGTSYNGSWNGSSASSCSNWTTTNGTGAAGDLGATDTQWSFPQMIFPSCAMGLHVYCFEQ